MKRLKMSRASGENLTEARTIICNAPIVRLVVVCAALVARTFAATNAQTPTNFTPSLESLVRAERAFAAMSVSSGTRSAFLANLSEEAIVFAPKPTNGKTLWAKRPESKSVLAWEPEFADVSKGGDMGYTYGPWKWSVRKDTLPSVFGHFVSVWKKHSDGTWKNILDMGISHPLPTQAPTKVATPLPHISSIPESKESSDYSLLLAAEKSFAEASAKSGIEEAYRLYACEETTFFRNGKNPFPSVGSNSGDLFEKERHILWETIAGDVAKLGDIGYAYGAYSLPADSKVRKVGHYVHIWKHTAKGGWKIVVDVTNPLPE